MTPEAQNWINETFPAGFSSAKHIEKWLGLAFDAGQANVAREETEFSNEVLERLTLIRDGLEAHMKICPLMSDSPDSGIALDNGGQTC